MIYIFKLKVKVEKQIKIFYYLFFRIHEIYKKLKKSNQWFKN